MRKKISEPSVGANPHRKDAPVKPTTESISSRFRPNALASHPVIGRMIALATRYDVTVHVASSIVAERLPAMCGSDTLTTLVSSTSMKVASITEMAMIHGLMCGCSSAMSAQLKWRSFLQFCHPAILQFVIACTPSASPTDPDEAGALDPGRGLGESS